METMMFLILGCLSTGFGLYRLFAYFRFFKKAILVEGEVTDYYAFRNSRGRRLYAPIVEYYFERKQSIRGEIGTSFRPKKGKKMTVGINPQNSDQRRLKQNSFVWIHLFLTGMGFLWLALYWLIR